ncbi:unnamed protein product [Linum trigynum]|uniref:Uncharacterized protein n=1 Tax=Linum trigynum TaxID=586398 RepID=A0AAV2FDU6_9ROSI
MGTGTVTERCSALEAAVEDLQVLVQADSAELEVVREQMREIAEVLKTLVVKVNALTPQREGKETVAVSSIGKESSEEREAEKSTMGMKTGESSSTEPKFDGSARRLDSAVRGSYGEKASRDVRRSKQQREGGLRSGDRRWSECGPCKLSGFV